MEGFLCLRFLVIAWTERPGLTKWTYAGGVTGSADTLARNKET